MSTPEIEQLIKWIDMFRSKIRSLISRTKKAQHLNRPNFKLSKPQANLIKLINFPQENLIKLISIFHLLVVFTTKL